MALLADRATAPAATRALSLPAMLLAVAVGGIAVVAIGLWCFTWPIADDFVRAVEGREHGILGGAWIEYTSWSCRWAAGLVHFLIAAALPLTRFYGASLMAMTSLSLLLLSSLVAGTLGLRWRSRMTLVVIAIFAALWWSASPSVNELFFWRAAAVEYQLGWSAAIALAFAACSLDLAAAPARRWQLAALAAAALFVSGLHELAAALEAGLFAVVAIGIRLARGRWRPAASVALAAALFGLVIVILAPGNGAREAAVGAAPPLWHEALAALGQIGRQVALWLIDPKSLAAAAVLIALRADGTIAPHWPERLTAAARWALTGVFAAVLVALYLVPAVALGGAVPARTLAGIHLVFLCGGLVIVSAWAPCGAAWLARRIDSGKTLRWALIVLALVLPASRNVAAGIADLRGPAEAFHSFMAARDVTLRHLHAYGVAAATVPVIAKAAFPRSYVFHADIRDDADFWINRWTARYYGLAAVRAGR
jgi:hypothetical protein